MKILIDDELLLAAKAEARRGWMTNFSEYVRSLIRCDLACPHRRKADVKREVDSASGGLTGGT